MEPNEKLDKTSDPAAEAEPDKPEDEEKDADAAEDEPGDDEPEDKPAEDEPEDDGPLDLDRRILCPDGACIGVIGPDGKCKVCGTPMDPADAPALAKIAAEKVPDTVEKKLDPGADPAPASTTSEKETEDGLDLEHRRLCSDGACIGVIGKDNRCKICGKPYTGDPS
jgi:hypothetical protein